MIETIFLIKIMLAFIVGGSAVSLALLLGEKFGPKVSAFIIGMPVASAVGLIFIGWIEGEAKGAQAASIMPITLIMGLVFLVVFVKLFGKLGLAKSLAAASFIFLGVSALAIELGLKDIFVNAIIYFASIFVFLEIVKCFPEKKVNYHPKTGEILLRGAIAGLFISSAVVAAKIAGPYYGGILAAFPATYFSIAFLSTKKHGIEFTKSIVKNVPLTTIGTAAFYICVNQLYPTQGILIGTVVGYFFAFLTYFIASKTHNMLAKKQAI